MSGLTQADLQGLIDLLNAGHLDKAVSTAKRLIGKFPQVPTLHLLLGVALASQDKLDPAIHSYRKALALKPDYIDAINNLGVVLRKQGKLREAEDTYAAALKVQPENAAIAQNFANVCEEIGVGLFNQRMFTEAVEYYRKALAGVPENAHRLCNLGIGLFHLGEFDESLSCFMRARQLEPDKIETLAYCAIVSKALGKSMEEFLKRIREIAPESWLNTSTKMWAALMMGDPEAAFSFRTDMLNIVPWRELGAMYRSPGLQERIQSLPKLKGSLPHQSSRPLLYAGGDGVYAERFAKNLIASALSKSPDCDFHIHLMNLGAFNPDEAFKMFPKDRVTWTIEDMGPCDKILFAPRRWIRLAQIQWQVERTIILIDTDSVVNGDIPGALPEKFDVVLYDRSDEPWAHQMVMGAFIAISPRGRDFTDFLAAYILRFEEAGIPKWFDDQFNMVVAREWFRANVPSMSIKDCPAHMLDWTGTHRPDSLVWHAKGNLKRAS